MTNIFTFEDDEKIYGTGGVHQKKGMLVAY
jgi:hypothetical protein